MSPEQARGELTGWARGPTFTAWAPRSTACLTGKPPFEGEDIGVILRAVQEGQFQRPSQLDPALDKAWRPSA